MPDHDGDEHGRFYIPDRDSDEYAAIQDAADAHDKPPRRRHSRQFRPGSRRILRAVGSAGPEEYLEATRRIAEMVHKVQTETILTISLRQLKALAAIWGTIRASEIPLHPHRTLGSRTIESCSRRWSQISSLRWCGACSPRRKTAGSRMCGEGKANNCACAPGLPVYFERHRLVTRDYYCDSARL